MSGMLVQEEILRHLCSVYDRSRLVPFTGSGMSIPVCTNWQTFVQSLEQQADIQVSDHEDNKDFVQRAFFAMQNLRLKNKDTTEFITNAVYSQPKQEKVPAQTKALASLHWPLVCTTNYDDVYLRAKQKRKLRVLGRSDRDCREILEHLSFPAGEVIWALQGFLRPREDFDKEFYEEEHVKQLEPEIVVGHAEYRTVSNKEPHFRRSFTEVFRNSSFLFLGSGLSEPYFLSLFDEIIELTGAPSRPHFALVQCGDVDPDFMRQRYHIECITYPKGEHDYVKCFLSQFAELVKNERARECSWGFRVHQKQQLDCNSAHENFKVIRSALPQPNTLPANDGIAISCGRTAGSLLVNSNTADGLDIVNCNWNQLSEYVVVQNKGHIDVFGIVAREGEKDTRSPKVIRTAFDSALEECNKQGVNTLHVQLLSAGPSKTFTPWISLVQMARAYGCWFRKSKKNRISVHIYIVDPSVIALLCGSFINLSDHLENTNLHVGIDVISRLGSIERHHRLVHSDTIVSDIIAGLPTVQELPKISVRPHVHFPDKDKDTPTCQSPSKLTAEGIGLVSGSTLVIDYSWESKGSGRTMHINDLFPVTTGSRSVHCAN